MNKVVLVGYPGSQRIVPASKYLTHKYMRQFDITYLNYTGDIQWWSKYVAGYLEYLTDEYVIFSLDDYLISDYIDMGVYYVSAAEMRENIMCVKMCYCTNEEHEEYPVTTQYCIWNRRYLIWLLLQVNTPWEFEIIGSQIFKREQADDPTIKCLVRSCLPYFTNSSISSRWDGVKLTGLNETDIKYITENGYIG